MYRDIGDRLKEVRINRNISIENLCKKLGISRKKLLKWEQGKIMPDLIDLNIICYYLNVSEEYILLGKNKDKENIFYKNEFLTIYLLKKQEQEKNLIKVKLYIYFFFIFIILFLILL